MIRGVKLLCEREHAIRVECCKIAENLQKSTTDELRNQYLGK
jgi:hypothetical protein